MNANMRNFEAELEAQEWEMRERTEIESEPEALTVTAL